jgi:hypothetical protein
MGFNNLMVSLTPTLALEVNLEMAGFCDYCSFLLAKTEVIHPSLHSSKSQYKLTIKVLCSLLV